jgi:hypothetical protein
MSNDYCEQQQRLRVTPSESRTHWPVATYQGILLHIIFALLGNNDGKLDLQLTHELPEIPSQLLVALVQSCFNRGMFFYPSMLAQFDSTSAPEVFIWVGIEEVKRFALALYRVCRQCRFHGKLLDSGVDPNPRRESPSQCGNLISLSDLRFALPDRDELWHTCSDLAPRLAESPVSYRNKNQEENWISQTARLLQPDVEQFIWI